MSSRGEKITADDVASEIHEAIAASNEIAEAIELTSEAVDHLVRSRLKRSTLVHLIQRRSKQPVASIEAVLNAMQRLRADNLKSTPKEEQPDE